MKEHVGSTSCSVNLCVGVLNIPEAKNFPLIVHDEECVHETCSFVQGLLPPSVDLGRQ